MTEATLTVSAPDELLQLFGPRDQHLRILRQLFDVTITHRNGRVRIAGEGENVNGALRALEKLRHKIQKQGAIGGEDVETAAVEEGATPRDGQKPAKAAASGEDIQIRHAGRRIRPRTAGQARYVDAIREHDLTFATGPAGCGKTFLAVATAVEALKAGQIRKIVLVRPAVEAGESLGFLPGDLRAKLNPYLRPLLDALGEMVDYDRARELMEQEIIEVIPLAYMRGRTLNDAFIILDEAQNTTIAQMKMFLTRMGERSKMVVSGDATQLDLPRGVTSGLHDALRRLSRIKAIGVVRLSGEDIVRHALVQRIVEAYDDDDTAVPMRQRRGGVRVVAESNPNGEETLDR
ncbi:PhoH family protein [Rhodopirellula sp. MGV]|uniref:PhoH family protein n=1 Tax=Rhodopirellula sp. MGV TaxID=2023130 RepID=UPI000B969111|nr:PhoH family protein [Rhodopirellula sp. MGV]OYP28921.1 phosphate starvation-inducible protein PhoH [Rhodopirellula sp. MGV]PNY36963.1 phosphate starvation-inducible protein PhoH [Rhodopirellula baltica]